MQAGVYVRPFNPLLLANTSTSGAHDETKADIRDIVQEAEKNGGYQSLEDTKKEVLVAALQHGRSQKYVSTALHPAVQLHDVRITFDRIKREVS